MLSDNDAIATVAVKNLETAKQFYEGTLDYDLPKLTRQGDVHVAGSMKTAWFKDPDGTLFSLVTPPTTAARETAAASARGKF
jgi:hypothetical protein